MLHSITSSSETCPGTSCSGPVIQRGKLARQMFAEVFSHSADSHDGQYREQMGSAPAASTCVKMSSLGATEPQQITPPRIRQHPGSAVPRAALVAPPAWPTSPWPCRRDRVAPSPTGHCNLPCSHPPADGSRPPGVGCGDHVPHLDNHCCGECWLSRLHMQ